MMIQHNLKIAWRNLLKYKLQTSISIISLTVGLVCFSLSALWLRYEESYDTYWEDSDDIYMIRSQKSNESGWISQTLNVALDHLRKTYPEASQMTYFCYGAMEAQTSLASEDTLLLRGCAVDSFFTKIFHFKVLEGDSKLCLNEGEIALSEEKAQEIFPQESAIGKHLYIQNKCFKVSSVYETPSSPLSYEFDFLKNIPDGLLQTAYYFESFVKLNEKEAATFSKKIAHVEFDSEDPRMLPMLNGDYDFFPQPINISGDFSLLPLSRVNEDCRPTRTRIVEQSHLRLFMALGILVICCALFNYFTMLVTRIRIRERELALRYVNGASLWQLIVLIATEIGIILCSSILLAFLVIAMTLEPFKNVCFIDEPDSFFYLWFFVYAIAVALISLVIASLIIAYWSRKQLRQTLDLHAVRTSSSWTYRTNIGLQLTVSIATIFCSLVMMSQIKFLFSSPDMGFVKHNVGCIVFPNPQVEDEVFERCKVVSEQLKATPEIEEVLFNYEYPLFQLAFSKSSILKSDHAAHEGFDRFDFWSSTYGSSDYFRFMQLKLVDGEWMDDNDRFSVVINESAAKALGERGKVGQTLVVNEGKHEYTIKGIVKDLCYYSPTVPIVPLIFLPIAEIDDRGARVRTQCPILIKWKEGVEWPTVQQKIHKIAAQNGFEDGNYANFSAEIFYDDYIQSERALCNLLMIVTLVCVLIAIFGIFSIISLACERRRKEIAIRKIHGAKFSTIMGMFLKEYLYLLLASAAIAFPIGYYLMHQWLIQYVKQVPIYWWLYPAITLAMALLIFLTIFWQIRKAANENPADVIKAE